MIKSGIYRHYKGNLYEVIAVAKHSETLDDYVIYKPLYKNKIKYWIRPLKMFIEKVIVNDKKIPRFKLVNKKEGEKRW